MYKTIDLFAGAGGLSFGFEATNKFLIVAAAESNEYARQTYIKNHKGKQDIVMIPDVRGYDFKSIADQLNGIDVVIGGPPCQGFSNANRQKNHIVSMNNSLVKEYFRAIKEIKPCAFVMENVAMLKSTTHKFYDSKIDHQEIIDLGIQMKEDELVILDTDYDEYNAFDILSSNTENLYCISDDLYQLLNVLYKNRNNSDRLNKYLNKYTKLILNKISIYKEYEIKSMSILDEIKNDKDLRNIDFNKLEKFIKFQKSFRLKKELDNNEIIYELYKNDTNGKILAKVSSYTVYDYVKNILGNDYIEKDDVINSLSFGVPQERKRFILVGIRNNYFHKEEIRFNTESVKENVTVGEAINDLQNYDVNEDVNSCKAIPYKKDENLSKYAKLMRKGSRFVNNHIIPKTTEKAKKRFIALNEGENFHQLTSELKDNYTDPSRTQNSIYLRLDSNKPSGTVVNVRKSMWIHPFINRAISVREAARLQSFPDSFIFVGTKDAQYQQVGNAVPPLMAKGIANILLKNIE